MAAEYADSVGVHLINSSLSYTTFDNPQNDYTYAEMDGNTTLITRAADIAASKGILVVTSVGNEGSDPWHYLGAPADGDSVLAIGAVNWQEQFASFSSYGPSADGRVKPDLVAQGSPVTLVDHLGAVNIDFGTSFSAPLVAGLAACLMEAFPAKHSEEIADQIRRSGHLYTNPNDSLGYGIPDFELALALHQIDYLHQGKELSLYPNPIQDHLIIDPRGESQWQANLKIYDLGGQLQFQSLISGSQAFRLPIDLPTGPYILHISGEISHQEQILIQ